MIRAFNHVGFTVADMDASVRFWTLLGFEPASVSPRSGEWQSRVTGVPGAELLVAHLYGHGLHLEFIQYVGGATAQIPAPPSDKAAGHVCLEVDDIEAVWGKLLKEGARPQGQIADVNTGVVAGCRAGYLRDPNGIILELLEMRPATGSGRSTT